jgi:hypothetical protein
MNTPTAPAVRATLWLALLSILAPAVLSVAALLVAPARAADASGCQVINDPDARTYCLAKARRDAGTCYAITRADLRAQCLAEVRK